MWNGRASPWGQPSSRPGRARLEAILTTLLPELQLDGTPYRELWREREARLVVVAGRMGLLAAAVGLVLHHYLVDLPLRLEPAERWAAVRFGGAAGFVALALLYSVPRFRRGDWARVPLLVGTLAISVLEAKTVEWLPSVPYFYAFVLAMTGVLLLRQALAAALATFALCLGAQWVAAWSAGPVPMAKLVSASLVGVILIALFRGRMAGDVRAFLSEKRELDAQKRLIETQIELDRVKTNFFTNVSHELRTPLTLVIAPLEGTLQGPRPIPPEVRGDLELALRSAQRLLGEINSLLDLARLDGHRERLRLEPVELVQVLRQLVESVRPLATRKHIDLLLVPEGVVPAGPLDRPKVEKVVLNLLSNALRFTDGLPQAWGRITVRCGQRGARLWCTVEDTGIGIPEEQHARIFDRFHQVEGADRQRRGGTGIGLSLVKQLVELHMGTVSLRSQPGRGSAFTIELPADLSAYPAERLEAGPARISAAAPPPGPALRAAPPPEDEAPELEAGLGYRPLVLLVDDNLELLDYVSRQLSDEFRTVTAADADAALRAVERELPDLVVSDLMMPGRSGAELLRELRGRPATARLPVVLLTARSDAESRVEALEGGADDYVSKPFNPVELRARIRTLLEKGRATRELADRNDLLAKVNLGLVLSKRKVLIETMEAFALAVEAKDPYTHGHSRRVSLLAERVCRELGLGDAACETIRIAGILHDIGKIGMPELVLQKPGRLSAAELEVFKRHAQLGSRIVSAVTELEEVGRAILHHHERYDGEGYPDRLAGERIPVLSRILTVCDAYDAMTSDRPYRTSVPHRLAMDELVRCTGRQFDPVISEAFQRLYLESAPDFPEFSSGLNGLAVVEAIRSAGT
jgi:putative nucleotidyltransferase with HDIG domain